MGIRSMHVVGGLAVFAFLAGCSGAADPTESTASASAALHGTEGALPNDLPFPNPTGLAATYSTAGFVDLTNPFFQNLGTNGRSCGSCHTASDGWTVTPPSIQRRFYETGGTDPIFRPVDGSNRPDADVSTFEARRAAYNMLLTKGLIRVGDTLGLNPPANADFTIVSVDDPYGYASPTHLSLFRRPLPSTNMNFLTTVMWDGRETLSGSDHCNALDENGKCFASMTADFSDQAQGATLGHAQAMIPGLTPTQMAEIVAFETSLSTAQIWDNDAHLLTARHALGGPFNISTQVSYYGINDNLGDYKTGAPFSSNVFTIYDAWNGVQGGGEEAARASVARGEALFNSRAIVIEGVAGLNGTVGSPFNPPLPASFTGACTTCHDTPNGGNHSIVAPLNIGLTGDHPEAMPRTPDLPLYKIQSNADPTKVVYTTDPGRALISGKFVDVGKFKGPILRGLAARAPYFHNGSAKDLDAVVDFYNARFVMNLSDQEHDDLVAFLRTL